MDIENKNNINVPIHHEGILYILNEKANAKKQPQYVIDKLEYSDGMTTYTVYRTKSSGNGTRIPVKDYALIETKKEPQELNGDTILVNLARKIIPRETKKTGKFQKVTKPPLYIAYQEKGIDTFSGEECYGFKEYTPDRMYRGNFLKGIPTGVFINDANIRWINTTIAMKDLINDARDSL